jgi:CubicO group peptidase (beta-lactamase class C family)
VTAIFWILFVALAAAMPAAAQSAAGLLQEFFTAVNSDDPAAIEAFHETGVSESFRNRRSAEERYAFYERIRSELGQLTVRGIRSESPTRAVATVDAERMHSPVVFTFALLDGKIDDITISVGGARGRGRSAMLNLPAGAVLEDLEAELDRQLEQLAENDRFSGVVLLARDGQPFFHRAYGLAERDKGREIKISTQFDVGSITKFLTRTAIAQLARAGKVRLSDSMLEHLPGYPRPEIAAKITIQHLLDHTSGLGDIFNERWEAADRSKYLAPTDFFPLFAEDPLQFEPGERRDYSNAGYVTLGAIVEATSGRPYFDYMEEQIFRPAAMTRSGFPVKDGSNPELAVGYTRGGPTGGRSDAAGPMKSNLGMLPLRGCPAGSSSHTAEDLLKLERALRAGKLLDPEWTAWVLGADTPDDVASASIGVAGGGPGVSAGWESNGALTAIVLANMDPPAGSGLALELHRALAGEGSSGPDPPGRIDKAE